MSKVTVMKDRVYIEIPKENREEIRQLRGESLVVDVNRVLTDREVKKDVAVSDREVKTVARDLHNQLERGKKRGKK